MMHLFEKVSPVDQGRVKARDIDYFKRTYSKELDTVIEYYNTNIKAVKNEHLLSRLLTTGTIPHMYDDYRYAEIAMARADGLARHFQLTSELSYGEIKNSVFYGPEVKEVLIYHSEYFNPVQVMENWKTVSAVRVLNHPYSDLGLLLPDGRSPSYANGLAFIAIDIPLLLMQYKGFMTEEYNRVYNTEEPPLLVTDFIHMFVLPNMLASHLDIALLNRLKNLYYSAPQAEPYRKHPFYITDYTDRVDKSLEELLTRLENKPKLYEWYLKNLPALISENQELTQQIPDLTPMRQVRWALVLSRLTLIKFLIDLGGERGRASNGSNLNLFKRELIRLKRDSSIRNRLDEDTYYDISLLIDELL